MLEFLLSLRRLLPMSSPLIEVDDWAQMEFGRQVQSFDLEGRVS